MSDPVACTRPRFRTQRIHVDSLRSSAARSSWSSSSCGLFRNVMGSTRRVSRRAGRISIATPASTRDSISSQPYRDSSFRVNRPPTATTSPTTMKLADSELPRSRAGGFTSASRASRYRSVYTICRSCAIRSCCRCAARSISASHSRRAASRAASRSRRRLRRSSRSCARRSRRRWYRRARARALRLLSTGPSSSSSSSSSSSRPGRTSGFSSAFSSPSASSGRSTDTLSRTAPRMSSRSLSSPPAASTSAPAPSLAALAALTFARAAILAF
mmetsp:Transcript_3233/g.10100  ORF Transcript_3233/g.10100 Transcript_3233/m.10100 type:complete len:272 (-) Transcript_3233:6192-7007(-)